MKVSTLATTEVEDKRVPDVGNVTFVAPVVVRVRELAPDVIKELPSATVSVEDVAGAVIVTLLTLVAVATPSTGVTKVGVVANTRFPLPVSSDIIPASSLELVAAKALSLLDVVASVPEVGSVTFVAPEEVRVILLAPEVINELPSANVKVADDAGVVIVTLLILVAAATPRIGVVRVGLVENTRESLPVSSEIIEANSEELVAANALSLFDVVARVPEVGRVTFVAPDDVNVILFAPEVTNVLPLASVRVAEVAGAVIVTLLTEVADATPKVGVIRVGVLANTREPLPVSSDIIPANWADVVAPNTDRLFVVTTSVAELGIEVPLIEVAVATPNTGVISVGVSANTNAPLPVSSDMIPAN